MAARKPVEFRGSSLDDLRAFPAVYVLHCFRKTTQKTSKTVFDLAAKRYRELTKELGK
jgi:phage-related protein